MTTASHNPEEDNGIKIADADGGMLCSEWESYATPLANASTASEFLKLLHRLCKDLGVSSSSSTNHCDSKRNKMVVHFGRDTRPHSLHLSSLAMHAALIVGATVIDHGECTTPQLHHAVMTSNSSRLPTLLRSWHSSLLGVSGGGAGTESGYFDRIVGAYISLIQTAASPNQTSVLKSSKKRKIVVDCACGVGGPKINIINYLLQKICSLTTIENNGKEPIADPVILQPVNLPGDGPLNFKCGADYVQKNGIPPKLYKPKRGNDHQILQTDNILYMASLDGDADRIVFHYQSNNQHEKLFRLLDGDKIAVLVSAFLQTELNAMSEIVTEVNNLRSGVVQTAYANGSSTSYLKDVVKSEVVVAKTGVKYVHAVAKEKFDIGTYFESNGHGTILFGSRFYRIMEKAKAFFEKHNLNSGGNNISNYSLKEARARTAYHRLSFLPILVNQSVGDALSDLLLVDAILHLKQWSLVDWDKIYNDMPSKQLTVRVKDRSLIKIDQRDESKVLLPSDFQPALNAIIQSASKSSRNKSPPSRAFARPSGTEDVVRVYAEAPTKSDADILATEAAILVHSLCNGVGDLPFPVIGRSKL